jgi:F420-dependent oxidoreductase-like protein
MFQLMRFSFQPTTGQPWSEIFDVSRYAERTGWDGIWVADHFMTFAGDLDEPKHECWSLLAALAAAVPRIRLGSLVAGNTYRHPAVLAKQAVTIDHVAPGRVVLGIGAGWQENEHQAYGIPFPSVRDRLDRLEESCAVISSLFRESRTTFDGTYYHLDGAPLSPKPTTGRLPLLVGGGGEKRTLRIAARYADEWNVWGDPAVLVSKGAVLDRHCAELGRDPASIGRSANALLFLSENPAWVAERRGRDHGRPAIVGTPSEVVDIVGAYRDAGVTELIIPDFNLRDPGFKRETMDLFMERVVRVVAEK